MSTKPPPVDPRPSASVILLSPKNKVLLLHRVSSTTSFASAHVFPGGNLDPFHDGDVDPPGHPARNADAPAYRRAAVRECFEESGILLARGADGALLEVGAAERDRGRKAVHAREVGFEDWVKRMGGAPDLDGLIPFTRWITPAGGYTKRFTTQMYLYLLPPSLPMDSSFDLPTPDGGLEHTSAAFEHPRRWLEMHHQREITMFPPQYYLLTLLSRFFTAGSPGSTVTDDRDAVLRERDLFTKFLDSVPTSTDPAARDHPSSAVPWAEKIISPRVLKVNADGSVVLGLDRASVEVESLEGGGVRGDFESVVVVKFGGREGGPWNYGVRKREEVLAEQPMGKI